MIYITPSVAQVMGYKLVIDLIGGWNILPEHIRNIIKNSIYWCMHVYLYIMDVCIIVYRLSSMQNGSHPIPSV